MAETEQKSSTKPHTKLWPKQRNTLFARLETCGLNILPTPWVLHIIPTRYFPSPLLAKEVATDFPLHPCNLVLLQSMGSMGLHIHISLWTYFLVFVLRICILSFVLRTLCPELGFQSCVLELCCCDLVSELCSRVVLSDFSFHSCVFWNSFSELCFVAYGS